MKIFESYPKTDKVVVCEKCDILLEYNSEDVTSHYGQFDYWDTIECPKCKEELIVAPNS